MKFLKIADTRINFSHVVSYSPVTRINKEFGNYFGIRFQLITQLNESENTLNFKFTSIQKRDQALKDIDKFLSGEVGFEESLSFLRISAEINIPENLYY